MSKVKRQENGINHTNGFTNVENTCNGSSKAKKQKISDSSGKEDFLGDLVNLILREVVQDSSSKNTKTKVVDFKHPHELATLVDFPLSPDGVNDEELMSICKRVVQFSVKTGHPHFFNQLYGGLDLYGLAGAWLTEALNSSAYTYEVSPVFTLMEQAVMHEMLRLIGFPEGDGIFCPGGSIANMYAINLARYKQFPDVKLNGISGLPTLCVMTSEKAHYSIAKGVAFLGLGVNNAIKVKVDDQGRMIPSALDQALRDAKAQGKVPIMVNATAGTTVLGAYDPLADLAKVCREHAVWLHVDGAWGASVLLSDNLKYKMKGLELCDSLTWNPHKMMGAPLQCSAFFTKYKTLLNECHSAKAKYLFQQDKFYDVSYDTGDKSIQCGRKVDALKLWMMWKAKGTHTFALQIENVFNCAKYLTNRLKTTSGFRLVLENPECTNVCFWFIPPRLRNLTEDQDWWNEISKVAPAIKQRMVEEGTMLIGYQPDGNLVNFFRMVVSNTSSSTAEMDFVVSEIERLGKDL